jgi:hypothetical protein
MNCYTHGDESELCVYENAICYDGERVVLSVPQVCYTSLASVYSTRRMQRVPYPPTPTSLTQPPTERIGSNDIGHVMRDTTANCYDFRYYEAEAIEYTNCRCVLTLR